MVVVEESKQEDFLIYKHHSDIMQATQIPRRVRSVLGLKGVLRVMDATHFVLG